MTDIQIQCDLNPLWGKPEIINPIQKVSIIALLGYLLCSNKDPWAVTEEDDNILKRYDELVLCHK